MKLAFWRKDKDKNDEALDFLTMPSEDVKTKKKFKLKKAFVEEPEIPQSEQEKMAQIEDKYLQIQPKGKKGKIKKILQIAFLVAVCILSIVLLSSIGDNSGGTVSFSEVMKGAKGGWLFWAFFGFVLLVAIDSFRFSYITKLTTQKFRPGVSFKVAVIGKYYDNITPLATGGQPFQMYYLAKKDIPAGVASSIPLIKYFITMFTILIVSLLLVIFHSKALEPLRQVSPEFATTVHIFAYVGIALGAIIPLFIILMSIYPKLAKKIISGILKFLNIFKFKKFKLIKDYQKSYYKVLKTVSEYRGSLKKISTKKIHIAGIAGISVIEFIIQASIPYFLCVSLGGISPSFVAWFSIMTLYVFVTNAVSFLPTPGNSGFAESSFFFVFAGLALNAGTLFWVVLFWRIITYYMFILLGMIIIFYDFISNTIKEKIIQRNKLINTKEMVLPGLNSWDVNQRTATVTVLKNIEKDDKWFVPKAREGDIKLFLKTNYSSIPYSPSALAYKCYENGSKMIGICDSETLSGAKEFHNACSVLGMGCSIGFEVKADLIRPSLNRRINNIYQPDIVNLAVIGIPLNKIDYANEYLSKLRQYRSERSRKMTDLINKHYKKIGVSIDYKKDVLPISNDHEEGTVTEMHVLLALCNQLVNRFGKGQSLVDVLRTQMNVSISEKSRKFLNNVTEDKLYVYDLQNVLKNEIRQFYIDADKECCNITDLRKVANECQAILTYPYMGDIEHIVFGENRVEVYEDSILDYLLKELKRLGITAVTVSPSRHTAEQIERVAGLCKELDMLLIAGETIYTRRQEIKYQEIDKEKYPHLIETAKAVCENEKAIERKIGGFFSVNALELYPDLRKRTSVFANLEKNKLIAEKPVN